MADLHKEYLDALEVIEHYLNDNYGDKSDKYDSVCRAYESCYSLEKAKRIIEKINHS